MPSSARRTFFHCHPADRDPAALLDPDGQVTEPWGGPEQGRCDKCGGGGTVVFECFSCLEAGADPECPACQGRVRFSGTCPPSGEAARSTRRAVSVAPLGALAVARRAAAPAGAAAAAVVALAEVGRRRAGGAAVFPATSSLLAPGWALERGLCSWLAVWQRLRFGGVRYGDGVIRVAAHSEAELRRRAYPRRGTAGSRLRAFLAPSSRLRRIGERASGRRLERSRRPARRTAPGAIGPAPGSMELLWDGIFSLLPRSIYRPFPDLRAAPAKSER